MNRPLIGLAVAFIAASPVTATASTFDILWWDSTPEYSGQAPNALREEMSDYLTNFDSGNLFSSTYVGSETVGTLATHLGSNTYDVIVFDATSSSAKFNGSDLDAVKSHYSSGKKNLMFDGNLYVRNITGFSTANFPGVNGSTGGYTVNQVFALANAGGGVLVGTDHNCCQTDANQIVDAILPGAGFSGVTSPSTDGVFNGPLLLNGPDPIAAADLLAHWEQIGTQGIAPTGMFNDFLGDSVTLNSLVDVANFIGGPKFSFVSTSLDPGSGNTGIDNPNTGGNTGNTNVIPLPAAGWLMLAGLGALGAVRRRRKAA